MEHASQSRQGFLAFTVAMAASLLSIAGTEMTQFAIIAWAWHKTGSTTATGLVLIVGFVTVVLVSIFSGALVDRWNRKRTIISTDAMGAVVTAFILLLYLTQSLEIWHLAILGVALGILEAFQFPAYLASITLMVPQEQRAKANSMFQLSWNIAEIVAAALGGLLYVTIGLGGILVIDLLTSVGIMLTISLIHIPQPAKTEDAQESLSKEVVEGFRYLFRKPSVLWTVLIFTSINVGYGAYQGLFRPMILVLTSNSEEILGLALAAVGVGSVAGGAIMAAWNGPKNRIPVILLSWSVMSVFGFVVAGLGRSLPIWLIARFCAGIFSNIALSLSFAIWQDKVDESIQGRVFSIIRLLVQVSIPISAFLTAVLADYVIEPAMQPGQTLAMLFGWMVGTGKGAGMSLILVMTGIIFGVILPLLGFLMPAIRNADKQRNEPPAEAAVPTDEHAPALTQ
ncbi:MAG TPA: MFS transporter [Herpetosiphonaceae bacterium]